jgi:catechol 2,3-dioxygenase-like lactoylglutathione lyase family enzyme
MPLRMDHITVTARDKERSMKWLAHILGVEPGPVYEPFAIVDLDDASLDYVEVEPDELQSQHIALRVDDEEFDAIFARIVEAGVDFYGHPQDPEDPAKGEIYYANGGRGFYFWDPNGHAMEVKTVPESFDPEVIARSYTAEFSPASQR